MNADKEILATWMGSFPSIRVHLRSSVAKSLAAIEQSDLVPPPSYVLSTSPDKLQVIWKIEVPDDFVPGVFRG
jgi:hypothetical protein